MLSQHAAAAGTQVFIANAVVDISISQTENNFTAQLFHH
jgi:hypothetical protein